MRSGQGGPRLRKRRRWVLVLVLLVIGVSVCAGLAPRLWPRRSLQDPKRLGLLQSAYLEFDAKRYDWARAILDRRTTEIPPTPPTPPPASSPRRPRP